jgi:hypothetical protein
MDRKAMIFVVMGFELVGLVTALVLVGRYMDEKHGWEGLGAGLGAFLGVMIWVVHMVWALQAVAKHESSVAKTSEKSDIQSE